MLKVGGASDVVCHSLEGVGQDVNQARAYRGGLDWAGN